MAQLVDEPVPDSGMWMVERGMKDGCHLVSIVRLDCILHGAHLTPAFSDEFVPRYFHHVDILDVFRSYYVNKYIDNYGFEIIFWILSYSFFISAYFYLLFCAFSWTFQDDAIHLCQ
jgi:hypothetical protein